MLRLGIDLGGTKTEGVVMDAAGEILHRERRATPRSGGYDAILENIRALVSELERRAGTACTVGIGTPGAISPRTGFLKNSNTVCLNGRPLRQDLERLLGREVRIANDANCFALSEASDGSGEGAEVVFGVILGTGVGGGLVIHGRLHEGPHRIAGEWGHNVLEANGPPCYCGKRGCVETFLSGPGLLHDYRAHGAAHGWDSAAGGRAPGTAGDTTLDARAIVERAAQGDALAEAAVQRYLDRFGRAMSVVINILDPEVIVLGGGMSNLELLYTAGRDAIAKHVFAAQGSANAVPYADTVMPREGGSRKRPGAGRAEAADDELRTRLVRNRHGDSSGVRGAARLWPAPG